jgi:hypothetical protein
VEGGFALKEYDLKISGLLDEISFVPRGANGKEYLLVKENMMKGDTLKSILETPDEELSVALTEAKLDKESLDVLEAVGSILKAYKDKLPAETLSILAKATGYPEPKEPENEGGKGDDEEDETYGCTKEQLEKMDPGTRAIFEKMLSRIDASDREAKESARLAKELKEQQLNKEYFEKAEVLKHIPGLVPEEHGPIMKALGESEPEAFEKFYDILKAADALLEKSKVWGEIGSGQDGKGVSANSKLEKIANGLIAKDADLTFEDAFEKACELNPELAAEALDAGGA